MTVQMQPGAGEPEIVNLSSLISLEDAGFPDADMCNRGIDEEHVEHLANSNMEEWEALKVVTCNVNGATRHAVIDGNHRWRAAQIMKAPALLVIAGNYASEEEVIEAAFRANMKNGRAASTGERTQYALWLFWQDPSDKPNMSAIARKVGLNHTTVSRAISKEVKRLEAEEEAEKRGTSPVEITETEKLLRAIRRYLESEQAFLSGERGERSVEKRAAALVKHIGTIKDKGKAKRAALDMQTLALTLAKIDFSADGTKRKNA